MPAGRPAGPPRLCVCGCGQPACKIYNEDGQFKSWRAYARGHAPIDKLKVIVPDDPIVLAYAAGIIDGEGCIYAKIDSRRTYLNVQVAMCSEPVIKWFGETFGGSVYIHQKRVTPLFAWRLLGAKCAGFLTAIRPYLKEKRRRAELAIELSGLIVHNHYKTIPQVEIEKRQSIITQIKHYNRHQRGEDFPYPETIQ